MEIAASASNTRVASRAWPPRIHASSDRRNAGRAWPLWPVRTRRHASRSTARARPPPASWRDARPDLASRSSRSPSYRCGLAGHDALAFSRQRTTAARRTPAVPRAIHARASSVALPRRGTWTASTDRPRSRRGGRRPTRWTTRPCARARLAIPSTVCRASRRPMIRSSVRVQVPSTVSSHSSNASTRDPDAGEPIEGTDEARATDGIPAASVQEPRLGTDHVRMSGFARYSPSRRAAAPRRPCRNFSYNRPRMLRFLTAGESHGPGLVVILEGMPAGLDVDLEPVDHELHRRQDGYGRGQRMKIERDRAEVLSGLRRGTHARQPDLAASSTTATGPTGSARCPSARTPLGPPRARSGRPSRAHGPGTPTSRAA